MSAFNSQFTDAGYYVPNQQQRFFASRALELLSIHREVIHGNNPTDFQQHSAGASTNDYCFKKPTYTATPWWPSIDTSVTSSTNPNLLLQPCFPWPLLTMSPVFGGDSVPNMPELLMPQTSPQTCTTGLTEASLALMNSLPSSPHAPIVCNDVGFVPVMQLDDDQLYSRICEYRASGMTWQDMSEAFSTIDGGGLSATHLAYFYFRRHPQQQSIPVASHRFVPYTVKKSSRKSDSTEHAKLAYLNVDQFKQLQRLVSECGEHNWEVISGIMAIRSGDLQKNWRGYTVHTNITRQWTRSEIEILALCRAIGVCCRTTAKLIGTKLPLQCRRKTIKHSDCIPATSVHCSANGPMYLVTSQQQPTSLAISHAFGLQQSSGQIEIDVASLAIARDIANTSVHSSGVRPILELAHRALPGYSQQTVNMCMLAILGSHPDYESGQQPPRSLLSAPPPQVKPVEIVAEETGEDDESVPEDLHKWSVYEIAVLTEYVEQNQGKKSWKCLATRLGTKTAAQCCNKYRSMRRYRKI